MQYNNQTALFVVALHKESAFVCKETIKSYRVFGLGAEGGGLKGPLRGNVSWWTAVDNSHAPHFFEDFMTWVLLIWSI